MPRIIKGGRELVVSDSDVTAYLNQGYAVIDEKGNVLSKAKAVTFQEVMTENTELKKRVKELATAQEAATTELATLKKQMKALKKSTKADEKKSGGTKDGPTGNPALDKE